MKCWISSLACKYYTIVKATNALAYYTLALPVGIRLTCQLGLKHCILLAPNIQHNDTKHNNTWQNILLKLVLSVDRYSLHSGTEWCYTECQFSECHIAECCYSVNPRNEYQYKCDYAECHYSELLSA